MTNTNETPKPKFAFGQDVLVEWAVDGSGIALRWSGTVRAVDGPNVWVRPAAGIAEGAECLRFYPLVSPGQPTRLVPKADIRSRVDSAEVAPGLYD